MYRFAIAFIIVVVLFILSPVLFPLAVLAPLFALQDLPQGISGREALEQNFAANRTALEAVVAETRTTKVSFAQRGYWNIGGYQQPDPRGNFYNPLYQAMRQAKIQAAGIVQQTPLVITLITDEQHRVIDTDRYGYVWVANQKAVLASEYRGLYGGYWLDEHWYLFEQIE